MLNTGTFIQNRYEIISKIGSGGMADVYKAKDHKLNRMVAVKVLKSEFRDDKVFVSKFRTEAQSAAGLSHGNIVNIYDVGEEAGINYIVMEYVEGITLKEYIRDQGRLSPKEATSITLQISAGLQAAHNNGIIHRDIKPQNIMISTDGKVKVTDFGIARASSVNTATSNVMGSVHYSSPEQARGGFSDEKSDIYSLGITMYEMLTGHVPFNGDTAVAVALQHLQEEMHGPKEEVPEIPYSTNQIVLKCTQKKPELRYQNMEELIRDLRESLVNPEGDFVTIPLDPDSPTMVMAAEDVDQLKSEQKMPSYDESIDVGAAADIQKEEAPSPVVDRAYQPGSYYQQSKYQTTGHQDDSYNEDRWNSGYGIDDLDNLDDPDYHYDPYDDTDEYPLHSDDDGDSYHLEDDYDSGAGKNEDDLDGDLNPNLERAVTIGGIIIAAVIGIVFLVLLANAFGVFRISGGDSSETNIVIMETETEKAAGEDEETERVSEKATASETEPQTQTKALLTFDLDDLSNMSAAAAENLLTSSGLKYKTDNTQFSETVPAGNVISTNPEAGTEVSQGDTVTLFVSQGSEADATYVSLWNLTGYTVQRAEEALEILGLSADYEYEPSDTVAEGYVIGSSADDEGGQARAGSTVTLYISTGPSGSTSASSQGTSAGGEDEDNVRILDSYEASAVSDNEEGSWRCDASLTTPTGYTGQKVRITLEQNGSEKTIFEGETSFPYHLQVSGEDNVATGTAYVYLLDDNGDVTSKIEYSGIDFSRVE